MRRRHTRFAARHLTLGAATLLALAFFALAPMLAAGGHAPPSRAPLAGVF